MPPQTTEDLITIMGPPETEMLAKPMMKMSPTCEGRQSQSGLMRIVSHLFESLIRFLNINWLLGFFGLALVKLEENGEEIHLNKRKNEDPLVKNEMKRLKSEAGCNDAEEEKMALLKNKSSLITDFTNKLWNQTPNINFSEDAEVETFLPAPKKVITPTKSFDNLVNVGLNEPVDGPGEQPVLEEEDTDVMEDEEEIEEIEEVMNYKAEASYKVREVLSYNAEASYRVTRSQMRDSPEKPAEPATVETELETVLKETTEISGQEKDNQVEKPSEEKEAVLDLEREKERVDDEAAEELLVMKEEEDAVLIEKIVQSQDVVSEKMEARAKENDKAGAFTRRNSQGKGKNRGSNKGKKRK